MRHVDIPHHQHHSKFFVNGGEEGKRKEERGERRQQESGAMAGLYEKQAEIYAQARLKYPRGWFTKLASLTAHHKRAWAPGTVAARPPSTGPGPSSCFGGPRLISTLEQSTLMLYLF